MMSLQIGRVPGWTGHIGRWTSAVLVAVLAGGCAGAVPAPGSGAGPSVPATPSGAPGRCADVDVVFARGTSQPPGFGRAGDAFVRALVAGLPARTVQRSPVDYPADTRQSFGIGTQNLIDHVTSVAASCPGTRFVLGGYSQGALVVSTAIGVPVAGAVTASLPAGLSPRVAAVVVFGNPIGAGGRSIETAPSPFRAQAAEFCTTADTVCGGRGPFVGTHHTYPASGATEQAAAFAIGRLTP